MFAAFDNGKIICSGISKGDVRRRLCMKGYDFSKYEIKEVKK
jgi:hypothetical protein